MCLYSHGLFRYKTRVGLAMDLRDNNLTYVNMFDTSCRFLSSALSYHCAGPY